MNQGKILFQIGTLYFQPNATKLNRMTETLSIDFFFFALGKNNIFFPTLLSNYCHKKWCRSGCQRHSYCVWLCGTYLQFPFRWFSQSALHHYFVRQANKLCSRPLQKNGDTRKIRLFSRLLWFASSVKSLCQKKKKSPSASVSLLPFAVGYFIYFVSVYFLVNLRHFSDVPSPSDLPQAERRWQTVWRENITKSTGSLRFQFFSVGPSTQ